MYVSVCVRVCVDMFGNTHGKVHMTLFVYVCDCMRWCLCVWLYGCVTVCVRMRTW